MNTITIKVKEARNAKALTEMLKALEFVESVEVYKDDGKLSAEEIQMVEESWEEYKKNPKSAKSWKEVKEKIMKKNMVLEEKALNKIELV